MGLYRGGDKYVLINKLHELIWNDIKNLLYRFFHPDPTLVINMQSFMANIFYSIILHFLVWMDKRTVYFQVHSSKYIYISTCID